MPVTPATFGRRYSPLIILAAVQLLLVVLAPSKPARSPDTALAAGPSATVAAGDQASSPASTVAGAATPGAGAAAGTSGLGAGSGTASGTPAASKGPGGASGGSATAATVKAASGPEDRSKCAPDGKQAGPVFYMPPCVPVFHGDNGGSTMNGVTGDKINFLIYRAQANAQVNAVLNTENLAATNQQNCVAYEAFTKMVNKRYELYGRQFVSLDGPGNNKGSVQPGQSCRFPYFQGQCSLTPPDPPCERAEARVIAAMKPAYVIAPVADPAFFNELAKNGIIVAGGGSTTPEPASYHTSVAPYFYDPFTSGTRAVTLLAEYYCKKMAGQPVKYAGLDVMTMDGPTAPPPKRKVAITYPATNGDPTQADSANLFIDLISGKMCGSKADGVKGYPYQSDINTAQQQSTTTVASMKQDHVTTVVCFCDPIAPVFWSNAADQQGYHPEVLMSGTGLLDYDVLGQLYNHNVWKYAFGISTLTDSIPFAQSDAVKAWQDAGNSGQPDGTENLTLAYFELLGSSFQVAGPQPTAVRIRDGLFQTPGIGGDHLHALLKFGAPDDYTGFRDAREIWWCGTTLSPINGQPGTYLSANGGKRYQVGQWGSDLPVFPNGPCA
jgi:hypothetical protein